MRLEEVVRSLHELDAIEAIRPHWEESVATLPLGGPSFLDPAEFKVSREWTGLGPELDPVLTETARRIAAHPALLHLSWHGYRCLFEYRDVEGFAGWPSLEKTLGELGGVFYLLVGVAMVPKVRALHESMGVSEVVTRDTCSYVRCVVERYRYARGGRLGMFARGLPWFRHYVAGDLFRIGRLEYMIRPFRGAVVVYRNGDTNEVLALAEDGLRFNDEGFVARPGGEGGTGDVWTTTLVEDDATVTGYPVSPYGMALRRQVGLPRALWRRVLGREHAVLQMHIPDGGGMTLERCASSMSGAIEFFQRYFPEQPFVGIACRSWIFNTQLQHILPPTANLVRYQRELYLFPIPSSDRDGLYFIFCTDDLEDWSSVPRDTSLQRSVADFLAAGNTWRSGGMFMLSEEVPYVGTQYYQRHWPPVALRQS